MSRPVLSKQVPNKPATTPWGEPYTGLYITTFNLWQTPSGLPVTPDYVGTIYKAPMRVGVPQSQLNYYRCIFDMQQRGYISELARLTAELAMFEHGHLVAA